jgi:hypothetical protein
MPPVEVHAHRRWVTGIVVDEGMRRRFYGYSAANDTVRVLGVFDSAVPYDKTCGIPDLDRCRTPYPRTAAWRVVVRRGGEVLWNFDVVRPFASSGALGSGIEIQGARYRGDVILERGHLPILNVQYQENECQCGPAYRDWLSGEACFTAVGRTVGEDGLVVCTEPPRTILDGSDDGHFQGLAVYPSDREVVVVSECKAAWYRYVLAWRFGVFGSIRPTIAFSATENVCTCIDHTHHGYFRLQFPPAEVRLGSQVVPTETRLDRTRRAGSVRLARRRGVDTWIRAGEHDGVSDAFGVADGWILRARDTEVDDLRGFTDIAESARAGLNRFVNGESLRAVPIALWHSVHFGHSHSCEGSTPYPLGPVIIPRPA